MLDVIRTLTKKEFLEDMRSYRLLIWIIVCSFFGVLSPLSAYYMPQMFAFLGSTQNIILTLSEVTYRDAIEQYIKNFTQIGAIILIFLTMGSIAGEKANGILQFLLVRPVPVRAILISKSISLLSLVILGIGISSILTSAYSMYLFEVFPLMSFIKSNILLGLYLIVIGFITLSLSAVMEKPLIAGISSLGVWLTFSVFGALGEAGWYSFTRLGQQVMLLVEGFPVSLKPVFSAILIIVISFICALSVLKRWESTS